MSVDVFSAILSYATIPIYVFGLLFLIYIIARSHLGFSFTGQVKQVVKTEVAQHRPKTPVSTYLVVVVLFILIIGVTIITERKQHL